ncbi:DUF5069 domain-containing protein [Ruficoccus sp. ZRK36]|uniref:DUF5069 domain-containing protein n=1 Tax=Ruficoccus sp. ZRK36 TaxID=2866311 RepID=UPI001C739026|nr:DUF5069 domain-containing protein [Ruficoccus sp. ZRK36]QYY34752.1 DUF5069 domain-containing protein [Ruficoccus sp. ZRK36]
MKSVPIAPSLQTSGMVYFPRMLDKIRKFAADELREDFCDRLGEGFDGFCCNFLRVKYSDLRERTLQGGSDEEILRWCFQNGRELNAGDLMIWNGFLSKVGWRDFATGRLEEFKKSSGLTDRDDIETIFEFMVADEALDTPTDCICGG